MHHWKTSIGRSQPVPVRRECRHHISTGTSPVPAPHPYHPVTSTGTSPVPERQQYRHLSNDGTTAVHARQQYLHLNSTGTSLVPPCHEYRDLTSTPTSPVLTSTGMPVHMHSTRLRRCRQKGNLEPTRVHLGASCIPVFAPLSQQRFWLTVSHAQYSHLHSYGPT